MIELRQLARPRRQSASPALAVRALTALAVGVSLVFTPFAAPAPRAAHASSGTWTQTNWTTPSTTLAVRPSGTGEYVLPAFGICLTPSGAACQGSGDTAPGQTLRLHTPVSPTTSSSGLPDLNGDGRPELIFANYTSPSFIYWGQPGGAYGVNYSTSARTDLSTTPRASRITVSDLNGDGLAELVQGHYGGTNPAYIFWGQPGGAYGVQYVASTTLSAVRPWEAGVADLNGDGRQDIVLTERSGGQSYIYWGQPGGAYGVQYSTSNRTTTLVTSDACGLAIGDLNGDGRPRAYASHEVIIRA